MEPQFLLKWLTRLGYAEGTSFLLLLGIAMPLKYLAGYPQAVSVIGMAHGVLFMAYVYWVVLCGRQLKWSLKTIALGVLASVLPFGPFLFDKSVQPQTQKTRSV